MDVIQGEHLATADGRRRPGAARNALIRACLRPFDSILQSFDRSPSEGTNVGLQRATSQQRCLAEPLEGRSQFTDIMVTSAL